MGYMSRHDRRRVSRNCHDVMPKEKLDIVCPKLYCRDSTPALHPTNLNFEEHAKNVDRPDFHDYRLEIINRHSAKTARLATAVLAGYFRRELEFDFIQYEANELLHPNDRVLLWTVDRHTHRAAVGAICFRWREYEDAPHRLALAWVWVTPFLRRKGLLSSHWSYFRAMFGDFPLETPISREMAAFILKRDECWKCGRVCQPGCERKNDPPPPMQFDYFTPSA